MKPVEGTSRRLGSVAFRLWPWRLWLTASWTDWQRRDWWLCADVESRRRRWNASLSSWRRWEDAGAWDGGRTWSFRHGVFTFTEPPA